jgi:hypothetical protein
LLITDHQIVGANTLADSPSLFAPELGHVGFFLRSDAQNVYLFGGNQLEEVRELRLSARPRVGISLAVSEGRILRVT